MFDSDFINDVTKRLSDCIPPNLSKFKKDLEKNFRVVLQSVFSKLDLVTREEFNVQKGVLLKTRAKLNLLEKQIAELETHLPKAKNLRRKTS
jgi:ubiquinone biosynthesis accessory factor UbiK